MTRTTSRTASLSADNNAKTKTTMIDYFYKRPTRRKQQQQQPPAPIEQLSNCNKPTSSKHISSALRQQTTMIQPILVVCSLLLIITFLVGGAYCVVVHQVRFIESKTGRTDYALAGETIELSCHYMMKDEAEDVKQIIWSKDGTNFLKWTKKRPLLEVFSYTFKGHLDQSSTNSHLIIHNVTIDMHGKYKCFVRTDLGSHEHENDLIIISSQTNCKLVQNSTGFKQTNKSQLKHQHSTVATTNTNTNTNSNQYWNVISDQSKCRESFKLDCRHMFPRPVPSCGLWNDKLDKFIRSVGVDISEESANNQTYRVRYSDVFDLREYHGNQSQQQQQQPDNRTLMSNKYAYSTDLLQYADHLVFKCDIVVPETSWRLSLSHRMFDWPGDGCNLDPLKTIERMRLNYSQYATSRMQKAGYLLASQHQLDDFEMLATSLANLKFEIIPLSVLHKLRDKNLFDHYINQNNLPKIIGDHHHGQYNGSDYNCWQRPRVGSLAKLSCRPSASGEPTKLTGAHLMECRPNGWFPITESSLKYSKFLLPAHKGRKQQHLKSNRPRQSRRTVADSSRQREELTTRLPIGAVNDLGGEESDENNDDDDDAGLLAPTPPSNPKSSQTTVTTTTESGPMLTYDHPPPLSNDDDDFLNGADDGSEEGDDGPHDDQDILNPAQLAAMLPSCVSTQPRHRQQAPPTTSNRLPLMEKKTNVLEAKSRPHLAGSGPSGDEDDWSWYRFFLFTASNSSSASTSQLGSLTSLATLFVTLFTMRLTLVETTPIVVFIPRGHPPSCRL